MKAFFVLLVSFGLATALTTTDYDTVRSLLVATMKSNQISSLSANLVRLSFHDCVSDSCDGCINMNNSANAGLQDGIDALIDVKEDYEADGIVLNWADLMALAGQIGAEYGMEGMQGHMDYSPGDHRNFVSPFTFKTGRSECGDSAPYTDDEWEFPEPHMNYTGVMDFFERKFKFSEDEVVALMGAHTLGACDELHSGYRGPWIEGFDNRAKDRTTFDNRYYSLMINTSVTYTFANVGKGEGSDARPQYDCSFNDEAGTGCGLMLNTDFEMFFDLLLDENFASTCEPRDCEQAPTYSTAENYANDNDLWLDDYVAVFEKMVERGYDSLDDLEED